MLTNYFPRPNTYAHVMGYIKMFNLQKYINIVNIQPVYNPHEIFLHLLDIIIVHHKLNHHYDDEHTVLQPNFHPKDDLSYSILCFMEKQPIREEGVNVLNIARTIEGDSQEIMYIFLPEKTYSILNPPFHSYIGKVSKFCLKTALFTPQSTTLTSNYAKTIVKTTTYIIQ